MSRPPSQLFETVLRAATEPGTPVRLYLDEGGQGFSSNVLGTDDGRLVLAPVRPAHGNLVLERLMGAVRMELMVAGLPHQATSRVRAVTPDAVMLDLPHELERVQRRRYFRVRAPTAMTARLHFPDGLRLREVLDISGGGCALLAQSDDADLAEGATIGSVQFALGEGRSFCGRGVVRRTGRRDGPWGRESVLGLEFVDLNARERYQLIAWVTERERALLRVRSLEPVRQVPDVVLLMHDAPNHVRLRPGAGLTARGVRVRTFEGEAELVAGATHADVELRVGGVQLFRTAMRCERADVVDGLRYATLVWGELAPDCKARLTEVLRG